MIGEPLALAGNQLTARQVPDGHSEPVSKVALAIRGADGAAPGIIALLEAESGESPAALVALTWKLQASEPSRPVKVQDNSRPQKKGSARGVGLAKSAAVKVAVTLGSWSAVRVKEVMAEPLLRGTYQVTVAVPIPALR